MVDVTQRWAEVQWTVLDAPERSTNLPAETRATPYVARVRGSAVEPRRGAEVEVTTVAGRRLRGVVTDLDPGYLHSFGRPLPEWVHMRDAIRRLLNADPDSEELPG